MDLSTSHKILYRLKGLSVLLIIIAISLSFSFNYQDIQAKEMFSTEDRFEFPENNGVLQFANVGEYDSAKYENSFWKFENLRLNYSLGTRAVPFSSQEFSFDISVKDSSVTIFSCRNYNSTFGAMPVKNWLELFVWLDQLINMSLQYLHKLQHSCRVRWERRIM